MSDGDRTRMRKRTVGFVFQKFNLLPNLTARDNIAVARHIGGTDAKPEPEFEEVLRLLGIGGTILGIIMSYGAYWLIHALVPASLPMVIVYEWWYIAGVITVIGALLGALYPGLTAAAHDPIEALAYE